MFTEVVAVVAREDEDGIVRQFQVIQELEEFADVIIHGVNPAEHAEVCTHFLGIGSLTLGAVRTGLGVDGRNAVIGHRTSQGTFVVLGVTGRRCERSVTSLEAQNH